MPRMYRNPSSIIECSLEASSLSGNVRNQFGAQNTTPSPVQPWATIPEIIVWDVA